MTAEKTIYPTQSRLVSLEALRGIAAVIVLVHHFFLGFSPATMGVLPENRTGNSFAGEFYFALFNGTSAVIFFFTLSGFVLCWSYFNNENVDRLKLSFLKRYPRLAGMVVCTTLASYFILRHGWAHFNEAAKLSNSIWLDKFAYSGLPEDFKPKFFRAFFQGLTTFFDGISTFNSNLWTMKHEFQGSLLVFMLAPFIGKVLRFRHLPYAFVLISASLLYANVYMLPFVAGAFLCAHVARHQNKMAWQSALPLFLLGLYLLGYHIPEKSYAWVSHLMHTLHPEHVPVIFHTMGSLALILAVMRCKALHDRMNNAFCRELGRLSFPLYLVHTLVICSISSKAYIYLRSTEAGHIQTLAATFAATALASLVIAWPLSRLDLWWVAKINRWAQSKALDSAAVPSSKTAHSRP